MQQQVLNLSNRELQIVRLICDGKTNKEISEKLFLSTRTVENYRMRISKKTGANTAPKVVVMAIRLGVYVP